MDQPQVTDPLLPRRRLLGLSAAAGAGLVLGPGLTAVAPAHAAGPPVLHSTTEWGAVPPSEPVQLLDRPPTKLFIHHTASANTTNYSLQQGYSLCRGIQRDHMQVRNFIDSGQQFTLTRGGHVLEGRHRSLEALRNGRTHVVGAHCTAQNEHAVGIENEGTYTSVEMRPQHYAALLELSVYICSQFGIRAYQIYGHRNFNTTECPGDKLYALLPKLRADIAARIGGDPTPAVWPTLRRGDNAERVRALQFLLRSRGATAAANGIFDAATESAVRTFQASTRASVDGLAGPQTWNQLAPQLARGSTGEAVKAVQNQLAARGIAIGAVDGSFGPNTETGVKTFQTRSTLPVDGVVDPRTLARLVG